MTQNVSRETPTDTRGKLMILVTTWENACVDSITPYSEKSIDYNDPSDRKWLAKHCCWAIHNGYEVCTKAI